MLNAKKLLSTPIHPRLIKCLALGQLLSICIAATGVFSEFLAREGVNTPTAQSALNYALLALAYGSYLFWRRRWSLHSQPSVRYVALHSDEVEDGTMTHDNVHDDDNDDAHAQNTSAAIQQQQEEQSSYPLALPPHRPPILTQPIFIYALLALLDVEGNCLLVLAYQYTSLTSVTLLDCFTIPAVMVLSILVLKTRYSWGHVGGAVLCVAGITLLVVTDPAAGAAGYTAPIMGDVLVLLGACLYAVGNVAQEKLLVSDTAPYELLAMLGTCGLFISSVQVLVFELGHLMQVPWSAHVLVLYAGFAAAMFVFYSCVPLMLMWNGAAFLNLSLLSADVWAVVARCIFFDGFPSLVAVLCFTTASLVTAAGILLFSVAGLLAEEEEV